jgi:hypothetical protein
LEDPACNGRIEGYALQAGWPPTPTRLREASSYDDGSAEMGLAAGHLDGAAEESVSIQGQAGVQLRQWLPTVPAADALDEVEGTDMFGKPFLYTMYPEPAPGVNP